MIASLPNLTRSDCETNIASNRKQLFPVIKCTTISIDRRNQCIEWTWFEVSRRWWPCNHAENVINGNWYDYLMLRMRSGGVKFMCPSRRCISRQIRIYGNRRQSSGCVCAENCHLSRTNHLNVNDMIVWFILVTIRTNGSGNATKMPWLVRHTSIKPM